MKRNCFFVLLVYLLILPACQLTAPQPVFSTSTQSAVTPIPLPSATPKTAGTLAGVIWSFEISPDASTIAFATSKGLVLYDLRSYAQLRTLKEGVTVNSLAWSPDGKMLSAGTITDFDDYGKAALTVWDTASWQVVFAPDFENNMVNERILDLAFSPDSKKLAFSADINGVMTLDLATGKLLSHQKEYASSVLDIAWSPDGSRLVSTGDMAYSVRRWKVNNDQAVRLFDQRASNPMHVAWMPDGKRIVSGHVNGVVCFWTTATNKCDGFIEAHRSAVFSMALSADGLQLATGGGIIRIWDTQNGELLTAFGLDEKLIYDHMVWPSSTLPLAVLQIGLDDAEQTAVRMWDVATGLPLIEFKGGKR